MANDRQKLESMLSAYLDGELSLQQRAEVEAFLADDADARQLLAELQVTVDALKNLPRTKASDVFSDTLRAQLERRALLGSESPRRLPRVSAPLPIARKLAAAAVIVMAVVAGYVTWSFTHEPDRNPDRYVLRDESRNRALQERERPVEEISQSTEGEKVTQNGRAGLGRIPSPAKADKSAGLPRMAMKETPKATTLQTPSAKKPLLPAGEAKPAPALADRDSSAANLSLPANKALPENSTAAAPSPDTMYFATTAPQEGVIAAQVPGRDRPARGLVPDRAKAEEKIVGGIPDSAERQDTRRSAVSWPIRRLEHAKTADDTSGLPVLGPAMSLPSAAPQQSASVRRSLFGYCTLAGTTPASQPSSIAQPTTAISVGIPTATQPSSQARTSSPSTSTAH